MGKLTAKQGQNLLKGGTYDDGKWLRVSVRASKFAAVKLEETDL